MCWFKSHQEENKNLIYYSIIHSIAVFLYVVLVAWFIRHAESFFGKTDKALTPVVVLMLFILSALVTSSLVLGRPIMMYLDGKKKEALKLLAFTAICLFILLLLAIGSLMMLK